MDAGTAVQPARGRWNTGGDQAMTLTLLSRLAFRVRQRMPVILQTELTECGLACLAMVAGHYGHRIDLGTMRHRFSASLKGMSLGDVARVASGLSLASRGLRLEPEELRNLRLPCVLHWDFGHFVVLDRITARGAMIHDPARGRRHVPMAELAQRFTGLALELWPTGDFEKGEERERIRLGDLFRPVVGLKRALVQILLLSLGLEVLAILSPIGPQIVMDQVIVAADLDLLTMVAIGLGLLLLLQTLLGVARAWGILVMGTSLGVEWETRLFDHLLRLPLSWFEKRHIGDVVSRFGSLGPIQSAFTTDLVGGVLDGLMAVGTLAMMLLYGGWLAGVALVTTGLYLLLRLAAYAPYRAASEAALVQGAKENSHFMESIRGAASIKMFGLRERRRSAWLNLLVDKINAGLTIQKLDLVFGTATGLLFGADGIAMLWLGARAVIEGGMTIGMLIAFLAYKSQFSARVGGLIGLALRVRMLSLHGERLADIALAEPDEAVALPAPAVRARPGRLEASGLRLHYGDNEPEVLRGLDLAIAAGESVAITGPSGCGKTTLLKVLAGLIPPTGGAVLLDGRDIRASGLDAYRGSVACVLQEDRLFVGTMAENIAAFDPRADQGWVEECARMAAIDDEIRRMAMGYETMTGDMGSALSGGQKQRLYLARALYRRPSILFLDEATSHLDQANEATINRSVAGLRISRVIVAHRPSTIAMADRIIALEEE
jgi:ATP-binding cassette subfamily B protein RaxB